jgi:hypothetical protein
MTTEAPDPQFRDNEFMVELARRLDLDPHQVQNMEATGDGSEVITVRWTGIATLPEEEFMEILSRHRMTEVDQ